MIVITVHHGVDSAAQAAGVENEVPEAEVKNTREAVGDGRKIEISMTLV